MATRAKESARQRELPLDVLLAFRHNAGEIKKRRGQEGVKTC
jgi:hypothetical protein